MPAATPAAGTHANGPGALLRVFNNGMPFRTGGRYRPRLFRSASSQAVSA